MRSPRLEGADRALIVLGEGDQDFYRAARNLAAYKVLPLGGLNVFDVLKYDELLMTEGTARALELRLGTSQGGVDSSGVTE